MAICLHVAQDELLDLVDDDDNVIGTIRRSKSGNESHIRVINIFVVQKNGKIIIPLRSADRRIFPNCYDFSVGGYVESGDSYKKTAYKELHEELGLENVELKELMYIKPSDNIVPIFMKTYFLEYDGDIKDLKYDTKGIQGLYAFSKDEIKQMLKSNPQKFKGYFQKVFEQLLSRNLLQSENLTTRAKSCLLLTYENRTNETRI